MDKVNFDSINDCYEALLDLKCIFPSWSELQGNFHYHWKKILNSSINLEESDNKTVKTYLSILDPLVNSKTGGIESKEGLNLVRNLDNYRKKEDEEFKPYVLEEVLNKDTPAIKRPKKAAKIQAPRKKSQLLPKIVLNEDTGGGHTYGTRRSKKISDEGEGDGKGGSGTYLMGQHLKKGFFSDYVWDFNNTEFKDEFED